MTSLPPHLAAFDVSGRRALVTGASSGLGQRFAEVLAAAGMTVFATGRRVDRLEALAAANPGVIPLAADLSVAAERERLASRIHDEVDALDVVVNNAGASDPKRIEDETLADFTRLVEVNLIACWHLAKLFGTRMAERGSGAIVNVASILGLVGSTPIKQAGYTASKGALVNMTRELGLQWARKGVRVNALCPGWFTSEMTEGLQDEAGTRFVTGTCPMPRFGEPAELDGALLLLASDASSYMTGATLVVDGGWTAR